jgi:hypothetical protein
VLHNKENADKIQELKEIHQAQKEKKDQIRSLGLASIQSKEVRLNQDEAPLKTPSELDSKPDPPPAPVEDQPHMNKKSKKKREL